MSSLEDLMQEAAARGLTHLSVYPVHSADRKTVYWHASASPSTEKLPSKSSGLDIVEVAAQALQGMSRAPKARAGKENQGTLPIDAIPGKETEDGNVTAAVKPMLESPVKPAPYPQGARDMAAKAGIKLEEQFEDYLPKA